MCARGGIGRRDGFRSHSERVRVQVLSGAPSEDNPNLLPVGDGFGFVFFYAYPNFNSKIDRYVH